MDGPESLCATRQERYLWHNTEARSCNHFCGGQAITITYSECVLVALASSMQYACPYCRLWPVRFWFSKKKSYWIKKLCFVFLHKFGRKHFSLSEEVSKIWSNICIGLHAKFSLLLSDSNEIRIFPTFSKYTQVWNVMKIRPIGAELFHEDKRTDGQTDITKIIVALAILRTNVKRGNRTYILTL